MFYYFLVGLMIVLTVLGQLLIKYGVSRLGVITFSIKGLLLFLSKALINFYIIGGLGLYFIAACAWLVVLTKIPLSRAYPFMALSFAFVYILSVHIFHESTSWLSWVGLILICLGLFFITRH